MVRRWPVRYFGAVLILPAAISAAMAVQTHDATGWVFCALFAGAAAYLILKKR